MSLPPPRLFGTDGIRALAHTAPLDDETVGRIGRAIAALLEPGATVVLGRDTRPSGARIAAALTRGLGDGGVAVLDAEIAPSPAVAHLVRARGATLGAVITASHNPPEYNGIKLLSAEGSKVSASFEREVEAKVAALEEIGYDYAPHPSPPPPPVTVSLAAYLEHLVEVAGGEGALEGVDVVWDCAHGAATAVAPPLAARLGLRVHWIAETPDGAGINDGCGALHPATMAQRTRGVCAALGAAFDGDADRVVVADERGTVHDGDAILWALARWLRSRDALPEGVVVATVLTNMGLERALEREGLLLERTAVGDRAVGEALARGGWGLGGEQSGHVIVPSLLGPTGDGLGVSLLLLRAMRERGETASALLGGLERYPQLADTIEVRAKPALDELPGAAEAIERARRALGDEGRLTVRYSGTEPVLRLNVEHRDAPTAERVLETLRRELREALATAGALA